MGLVVVVVVVNSWYKILCQETIGKQLEHHNVWCEKGAGHAVSVDKLLMMFSCVGGQAMWNVIPATIIRAHAPLTNTLAQTTYPPLFRSDEGDNINRSLSHNEYL